ncbi:hypothetical protein ROZALSC1DRAFT_27117, partial [Rozella allomycis CSF55]
LEVPKESGIVPHRDPQLCSIFWLLLQMHRMLDFDKEVEDWTDFDTLMKIHISHASKKACFKAISSSTHTERISKVAGHHNYHFTKCVHLGRKNCAKDLQEAGVDPADIRIGLHWKHDVAEGNYFQQLPIRQIVGSAGYSTHENYDPVHLKIVVPDHLT